MNQKDRSMLVRYAHKLLRFWLYYIRRSGGDDWKYRAERQSFHDSLESLRECGLISDYSIVEPSIT